MALPYHLYVISTQVPNMPESNMMGTLFVLVFITVGFNLLGAYIRNKFRKFR
jgi:phosphate transport system permease protein